MAHLNFKGNNPGAVKHGNFINYYQFHPPKTRLQVLPADVWKETSLFVGLDVGCNTGDLTTCIHEHLTTNLQTECKILGIDLDQTLIERANENNVSEDIQFRCLDITDEQNRNVVLTNYLKPFDKDRFDAIFCFSVTMWIHLNNGDDGLTSFLETLSKITDMIIVEPQPWKCYKAAVKRLGRGNESFPNYKNLKLRDIEHDIVTILIGQGFTLLKKSEKTEWGRTLLIFKNNYT